MSYPAPLSAELVGKEPSIRGWWKLKKERKIIETDLLVHHHKITHSNNQKIQTELLAANTPQTHLIEKEVYAVPPALSFLKIICHQPSVVLWLLTKLLQVSLFFEDFISTCPNLSSYSNPYCR